MLSHRILFSEAAIAARVKALAEAIRRDAPHTAPVLVGLLTGSFVFIADLVRAGHRLGLEPLVDFIAVSHYTHDCQPAGTALIYKDVALDLRGRAVVLLDDILDSGISLRAARDHLMGHDPSWLRTCVLLDKPARRVVDLHADYVGFEVPDVWVIGYGLDAGGAGRALPYIAALDEPPPGRKPTT